jgi:hypothetical protein
VNVCVEQHIAAQARANYLVMRQDRPTPHARGATPARTRMAPATCPGLTLDCPCLSTWDCILANCGAARGEDSLLQSPQVCDTSILVSHTASNINNTAFHTTRPPSRVPRTATCTSVFADQPANCVCSVSSDSVSSALRVSA